MVDCSMSVGVVVGQDCSFVVDHGESIAVVVVVVAVDFQCP